MSDSVTIRRLLWPVQRSTFILLAISIILVVFINLLVPGYPDPDVFGFPWPVHLRGSTNVYLPNLLANGLLWAVIVIGIGILNQYRILLNVPIRFSLRTLILFSLAAGFLIPLNLRSHETSIGYHCGWPYPALCCNYGRIFFLPETLVDLGLFAFVFMAIAAFDGWVSREGRKP